MNSDDKPPNEDKNLARNIQLAFAKLTGKVLSARPKSLEAVLALRDLVRDEIWGSDLTAQQRQERLFTFDPKDPEPWDKLEIAVLNSRCLPLPESKLPASQTELLELCRNFLDRTRDFDLLRTFVEGWRDELLAEPALNALCLQLWQTRINDGEFYRAVVSGMHGTAVSYLVHKRIPLGLTSEEAVRLIYRMALIWCAHDVQATAARARRSMRKPLGWLLSGTGSRMRVGTVLAICRPVYRILAENGGRYRTNEEIRQGKEERKPTRHDDVKTIRTEIEPRLDRTALADSTRNERDGLIAEIRTFMAAQDDLFWNELRNDRTSKEVAGLQIGQLWYNGLTPLRMIAVSVIRLIQMEAILESRIASMYKHLVSGEAICPPLLEFRKEDLPDNWRKRALLLIGDLRRVILDDPDRETRCDEGEVLPHLNDDFLDAALEFFEEVAKQPVPNDSASLTGPRCTLSLLNVCAVVRIAR